MGKGCRVDSPIPQAVEVLIYLTYNHCLTNTFSVLPYVYFYTAGKNRQRSYLARGMNDKQTVLQKEDQAVGETTRYWQDQPDVLEVPARQVDLSDQAQIRYGTIGEGMDLGRMVWPHGEHVLAIEKSDLRNKLPRRPNPAQTYLTGRVPRKFLGGFNLDCLLVDGDNINWLPWLNTGKNEPTPRVIIWMVSVSFIGNDKTGPMSSGWRKLMSQRGYSSQFWHLCAEAYGAALRQDRLAVICYRDLSAGPRKPVPMALPARAMSNLLLPVGIPSKAWYHGSERKCTMEERARESPCVITYSAGQTPIHDHVGPMPDRANAWIRSERGVRRLQLSELAKAKGLTSAWTNQGVSTLETSWVIQSTCLHLWTAVMDSVGTWLHHSSTEGDQHQEAPSASPRVNAAMERQ